MSLLWWAQKIGSNWVALQVLLPSLSIHGQEHGLWLLLEFHQIFPLCLPLPLRPPLPLSCPPPPLPLRRPPRIRTRPRPLTLFLLSFSDFLLPTFNSLFALWTGLYWLSHHLKQATSILSGCVQSRTCVLYLYLIVATCVYQYGWHVH